MVVPSSCCEESVRESANGELVLDVANVCLLACQVECQSFSELDISYDSGSIEVEVYLNK